MLTQFSQTQKNQLIDFREHLESYYIVLLGFDINGAEYDINIMKSYLLLLLVNERGFEPTVIKKANQFIIFKFEVFHLVDRLHLLGIVFFFKAHKIWGMKNCFPYAWFEDPEKLSKTQLPH